MRSGEVTRDRTYFISDLHFGIDGKISSVKREEIVIKFLQSIEGSAKRLVLLGDIFDFWFEYYKTVPKGYIMFQSQIKKMTSLGIEVMYFVGNHDLWQKDYFEKELGVKVYRKKYEEFSFEGKTFLLGHGDGLDSRDIGYKLMDAIFSNHFAWFLFSLFPSCVGIGLAELWSHSNRRKHNKYDTTDLGDKEGMYAFCQNYVKTHRVDYIIFGHRHIVKDRRIGVTSSRYINTGAWINETPYAVFDGEDVKIGYYGN